MRITDNRLIGFIENLANFKSLYVLCVNGASVPDRLFTVSTQSILTFFMMLIFVITKNIFNYLQGCQFK